MHSRSRLSIVENMYFQEFGEQPTQEEARFSVDLKSQELPHSRRYIVTEDWVALDYGGIVNPAMLRFENLEGRFSDVIPSLAAKAAARDKVVELDCNVVLVPSSTCRFAPGSQPIRMRCRKGSAKVIVTVYPE